MSPAVARATSVCDRHAKGDTAQLPPQGLRTWALEIVDRSLGCCTGKRGSGLALPAWPGAGHGQPMSTGHGVPAAPPTHPASHPARIAPGPHCGISADFQPGLQWWLWGNDGQLGVVEKPQGLSLYQGLPLGPDVSHFPLNMGLLWCWGLLPSTHGCMDSVPTSQSRCWHGVAHLQSLWHHLAVVPLGCSRQRLEGTDCPMPWCGSPGAAVTGAGLSIPADTQDCGPAPAPAVLPGSRASAPACPPHRPLRRPSKASVSQQWGPIRNEMFLLGYFICTLQ